MPLPILGLLLCRQFCHPLEWTSPMLCLPTPRFSLWLCICDLVKQGIVIVGPLLKIEVPTHSDPELVQLPEIFQLLDQSSWKVNESNFSQLEHFHLTLQSEVAQNEKKSWQCEDIVWGRFLSAVRVLNFEILHWASEEACNDIMSD